MMNVICHWSTGQIVLPQTNTIGWANVAVMDWSVFLNAQSNCDISSLFTHLERKSRLMTVMS